MFAKRVPHRSTGLMRTKAEWSTSILEGRSSRIGRQRDGQHSKRCCRCPGRDRRLSDVDSLLNTHGHLTSGGNYSERCVGHDHLHPSADGDGLQPGEEIAFTVSLVALDFPRSVVEQREFMSISGRYEAE